MSEDSRKPLYWIIKIWTSNQGRSFKHPKRFDSFEEASQFKMSLDKSLQEDNILVLMDQEKNLDLTINVNQIVTMKVSGVYEQGDEEDERPYAYGRSGQSHR